MGMRYVCSLRAYISWQSMLQVTCITTSTLKMGPKLACCSTYLRNNTMSSHYDDGLFILWLPKHLFIQCIVIILIVGFSATLYTWKPVLSLRNIVIWHILHCTRSTFRHIGIFKLLPCKYLTSKFHLSYNNY